MGTAAVIIGAIVVLIVAAIVVSQQNKIIKFLEERNKENVNVRKRK